MKRKTRELPKERNVFVAKAMFRKAGAHTKTTKAMRKAEKQKLMRDWFNDGSKHCFDSPI